MKQLIAKAALALLVLILLAPVLTAGALALSGSDPLLYADLSRADFQFNYVPQANSDYALYLFSADGGEVTGHAEILSGGEVIAQGQGSGMLCSARLVSGRNYTMRVRGSGSAVIEVARNALSRSSSQPLQAMENEPFEKMIAHAYDAHWYSFRAAASGPMMFTCVPQDPDLNLQALVFDENLNLAGRFESIGSACRLIFETRAGSQYYLRLSDPGGGEGFYTLNLHRPDDASGAMLAFDAAEYIIAAGSEIDLAAELGKGALLWVSDHPEIAAAAQNGMIRALQSGEATITAYGMNNSAAIRICVEEVPLREICILGEAIELSVGDETDIHVELTPENASVKNIRFETSDPEIANVSPEGVLTALKSGKTRLTAIAADSGLRASIPVTVIPASRRYRALLVGEENYPFDENTLRSGSDNSVSAIASLLETVRFEGAAYSVRTEKDLSRAELLAAIRSTFQNASPQDVSLLYITCHGSFTGGMSFLELSDGSVLSARDLERELRSIPGSIVVMIDCCGSGGAIGAASSRAAFARGITGAFSGASIRGSKFKVIASAGLDEDSFRIAFNEHADSGVMATVFARALCDGAGWNIDLNTRGTMGADGDYNGEITLGELELYMKDRVNWYLEIASQLTGVDYRQSIQVYPQGDPLVLFERKS